MKVKSKTKWVSITILLTVFAINFMGCLSSSNSDEPVIPGTEMEQVQYSLQGDFFIYPPQPRTHFECGPNSEIIKTVDTTIEEKFKFEIHGDSLHFLEWDHRDRSNSGAVIQWFDKYYRIGAGVGIEGVWKNTGKDFRIDSGSISIEKEAYYRRSTSDSSLKKNRFFDLYQKFSGGIETVYLDRYSAEEFIANWNGTYLINGEIADSANYRIQVTKIDAHTVELQGQINMEKVTIKETDDGSRFFESTNPSHAKFKSERNPLSCPDKYEPDWYSEFLTANPKK